MVTDRARDMCKTHTHTNTHSLSVEKQREIILKPLLMTHKDGGSVHPHTHSFSCLIVCVCLVLSSACSSFHQDIKDSSCVLEITVFIFCE